MGIIAERWVVDDRVQITVQRASGASRLIGLLAAGPPPPGHALLIPRCRSVHGFGMRAPLDVVFLAGRRVLAVRRLRPGRVIAHRSADAVLELAAGEAARLGIESGAELRRHAPPEPERGRGPVVRNQR